MSEYDDYYGEDKDYIHLKFGEARKCYNFTDKLRNKYPEFCKEYELYWVGNKNCRFKAPLEIAQYVDMFDIPVTFYFNFTDTVAKNIGEVYSYFIREYGGISTEPDGTYRKDWQKSLDGQEPNPKRYEVKEVKDVA